MRSDADDQLYRIDLTTGVATAVGATGFGDIEGLAFSPTGVLYGVDDTTDQLVTCSTTTGACTTVGPLNVLVTDVGLTFNSAGQLFMSTDAPTPRNLYRVDPTSGAATLIGDQGQQVTGLAFRGGISGCASGVFGIGGDSTNNLGCLNTTTGAFTQIGPLGAGAPSFGDGGIDFDANGTLWGILDVATGQIITIDPLTGTATAGATTGLVGFESLAIAVPASAPPIPALDGLALLALVALLAVAGAFLLRSA